MQVLVYHDLLGMLQHPHHAKVWHASAYISRLVNVRFIFLLWFDSVCNR